MLKAKMLAHIRKGMNLIIEGDEYKCKGRGLGALALQHRAMPLRFFMKSPLSIFTSKEYNEDKEVCREKMIEMLEQLVKEEYLIPVVLEKSTYYKPTLKVNSSNA